MIGRVVHREAAAKSGVTAETESSVSQLGGLTTVTIAERTSLVLPITFH